MAEPSPPQPALQGLAFFIDQALPQTQCTRCGYPDCASYAQAIATDGAPINQCAPGGMEGVQRLAALTGQAVQPLNRSFGVEGPLTVARIDEAWCIGCTLCIKACPTDAILGANKHMHTIISAHCTGCELCLPVCPVDCIELDVVSGEATGWQAWSTAQADHARSRYAVHRARLAAKRATTAVRTRTEPPVTTAQPDTPEESSGSISAAANAPGSTVGSADTATSSAHVVDPKKAAIAAALAKARALRAPAATAVPGKPSKP
ncbi:RnfABCDGE type electron transport complex subunit B [Comamonas sp. 17RB]|uniref:RnfABCDGE type electron transport complex subunit B n=1 Tax=Comamonas sp. 17RB TaxID=3047025 RepID=UPI0024B690FD|nr:RnfABCDGE type electron transport complex subunit B [Comamonas sp. 17RB]MDI9855046.1 RnfABCDGE type electron transport complex subunit B [Comamonas sp. 17RB]